MRAPNFEVLTRICQRSKIWLDLEINMIRFSKKILKSQKRARASNISHCMIEIKLGFNVDPVRPLDDFAIPINMIKILEEATT